MVEIEKVVDRRKLDYDGILSYSGFYKVIDEFFFEKGYDRQERINKEYVTPSGREVDLELIFWKKLTDYFESRIKFRIKIFNLENDPNKKMQHGKLMIMTDGYIRTDYDVVPKWRKNTGLFIIGKLFENLAFKREKNKFKKLVEYDVNHLFEIIENYLDIKS